MKTKGAEKVSMKKFLFLKFKIGLEVPAILSFIIIT